VVTNFEGEQQPARRRKNLTKSVFEPRGGLIAFIQLKKNAPRVTPNENIYGLISFIISAIRSLDAAHNRSTERTDTPSASALSEVEKPAK